MFRNYIQIDLENKNYYFFFTVKAGGFGIPVFGVIFEGELTIYAPAFAFLPNLFDMTILFKSWIPKAGSTPLGQTFEQAPAKWQLHTP